MTNEEAKAYFIGNNERIISVAKDENMYNYETQQIEDVFARRTFEANEMAIKALDREPVFFPPCQDCNTKMDEIRRVYDKLKNQESCDDTISRILKRMWNCRGKHTTSIDKVKMEQIIRDELSSVNPRTDVLDKIEAEIEAMPKTYPFVNHFDAYIKVDDVNNILDKYKSESGVEE